MGFFYNKFNKQLKKIGFFEKKATIAVAVSGGVDSIVLVYLMYLWVKKNNFNIIALIVDHKLRKESSLESKKVSFYLSHLGIKNKVLILKKTNFLTGIQHKARMARLEILHKYFIALIYNSPS